MSIQKHTNKFSNPEWDSELIRDLKQITEEVKLDAQTAAARNQPLPKGDNIASYYEKTHHKYQALLDRNNELNQFKTTRFQAQQSNDVALDETQRLQIKQSELKDRRIGLKSKFDNMAPSMKMKNIVYVGSALAVVGLTEGMFSIPVFQVYGSSLGEAIVFGALFGALINFIAHIIPWLIALGRTKWQRRVIVLGIFTLTTGFLYQLATVRADYLTENARSEGMHMTFSSWPFTLASVLLILVAVVLPIIYLPTSEERKAHREYVKAEKDLARINKEIADTEIEMVGVRGQNANEVLSKASELEYGQAKEQQIISQAMISFNVWKDENLKYRTDSLKPDCFNQVYPLPFTKYFNFNN